MSSVYIYILFIRVYEGVCVSVYKCIGVSVSVYMYIYVCVCVLDLTQ